MQQTSPGDEHSVHEAFGPPIGGARATAVIVLGVISLLPAGMIALANDLKQRQRAAGAT